MYIKDLNQSWLTCKSHDPMHKKSENKKYEDQFLIN